MKIKESLTEFLIILLATIILAITVSAKTRDLIFYASVSFLIIILANIFVKKIVGYFLEIKVKTKFWSWYQFGFRKTSHFKSAIPMAWLPLLLSLLTRGIFWWLAILEFDVEAKTERVSKRHGLYRFTEVTEWHIAWIAAWGIIINLVLAVIAYFAGFELFSKLSVFYAVWSVVPLSSLDGSKIFFASRALWITITTIVAIFFIWGLAIV